MEVTDGSMRGVLIKDKRYDGYCIELIQYIATELKFQYEFELVPDGFHGTLNKETKTWNGLIGQLLNHVGKPYCVYRNSA